LLPNAKSTARQIVRVCPLRFVIAAAAILLNSVPLLAADLVPVAVPVPSPKSKPTIESSGPSFAVTGYLWASALNGRSSTLPPLPATDIDLSFGDILKNMNGAMMGAAEMRLGRWGFVTDAMFSQVTAGGALPGPYFSSAKVRSQTLTLQASVLYRLYADERFDLDVGAGFRFWNLDNRLTIQPGSLNLQINHSESENWFDPVISARMITRLGGPWSVTLAGDIGGFDAGARLTWQALGTVNYQWNDNWRFQAGYRALYVDYRKGDFFYDTTMHGPIIAATYRF
jgi:opacity protein-like surface antigen